MANIEDEIEDESEVAHSEEAEVEDDDEDEVEEESDEDEDDDSDEEELEEEEEEPEDEEEVDTDEPENEEEESEEESVNEARAKSEPSSRVAMHKEAMKPVPSMMQLALAEIHEEISTRAEAAPPTAMDFSFYLKFVPRMVDISKIAYVNWQALNNAKSWDDLTPLVIKDIEAFVKTFKIDVPEKMLEFIIHGALSSLEIWAPIHAIQTHLPKVGDAQETDTPLEVAAKIVKDAGFKVVNAELFEEFKTFKKAHQSNVKSTATAKKKVPPKKATSSLKKKKKSRR